MEKFWNAKFVSIFVQLITARNFQNRNFGYTLSPTISLIAKVYLLHMYFMYVIYLY